MTHTDLIECTQSRTEGNQVSYLYYDETRGAYVVAHYLRDEIGLLSHISTMQTWDIEEAVGILEGVEVF